MGDPWFLKKHSFHWIAHKTVTSLNPTSIKTMYCVLCFLGVWCFFNFFVISSHISQIYFISIGSRVCIYIWKSSPERLIQYRPGVHQATWREGRKGFVHFFHQPTTIYSAGYKYRYGETQPGNAIKYIYVQYSFPFLLEGYFSLARSFSLSVSLSHRKFTAVRESMFTVSHKA